MKEITVIEDDELFFPDWELVGKTLNIKVNIFRGLDEFEQFFDFGLLNKQLGFFIDYDLGTYDSITVNIAKRLKNKYEFSGPVSLITIYDTLKKNHDMIVDEYYDFKLDKKEDLKIKNIDKIKTILGISK